MTHFSRKEKQLLAQMKRAAMIQTRKDTRFEGKCYKALEHFEEMLHHAHTRGDITGGERYAVRVIHEMLLDAMRENNISIPR